MTFVQRISILVVCVCTCAYERWLELLLMGVFVVARCGFLSTGNSGQTSGNLPRFTRVDMGKGEVQAAHVNHVVFIIIHVNYYH